MPHRNFWKQFSGNFCIHPLNDSILYCLDKVDRFDPLRPFCGRWFVCQVLSKIHSLMLITCLIYSWEFQPAWALLSQLPPQSGILGGISTVTPRRNDMYNDNIHDTRASIKLSSTHHQTIWESVPLRLHPQHSEWMKKSAHVAPHYLNIIWHELYIVRFFTRHQKEFFNSILITIRIATIQLQPA